MPITLGIRWQGKTHKVTLQDGACARDLQEAIAETCSVAQKRQQLRGGFPPKPLDLAGAPEAPLAELGLRDRDAVVLQEVEPPQEAEDSACLAPPTWSFSVLAPEAVGDVERLVIPADNSCLFSAILTTLQLTQTLTPMKLREAVKNHILADPSQLDAHCQADSGRGSLQYAEWILQPDSWGGFIDMHILSGYLGVQICAVCIRTLRVESFPNEPTGDARVFLLYDGIHYDCVMAATPGGGPQAGAFSVKDEFTLNKVVALAADLQNRKQFTDTANFTLQCQHCFKLLRGEADAQQHAKETGHFNFQEAPAS